MDEDFDLLSLAIESVENEIDKNSDKEESQIKSLSSCNLSKNVATLQSEPEECKPSLESPSTPKTRSLVPVDLFSEDIDSISEDSDMKKNNCDQVNEKSFVHSGDTDSSDDEDNKYFEVERYDSFGKFVKNKLKNTESSSSVNYKESSWKKNSSPGLNSIAPAKAILKENKIDVNAEPIFGIRIINPLVSSQIIKEKMIGRTPIVFSKIKSHVTHGDLKNDWVIAAVLVKKLPPRVSQNGNNYSSWILSDLKSELKTVFLFLFGRAHQELWKTSPGTVFAVLNPSVLNDSNSSSEYEAKLSIKSPDQVMVWGRSKDLGHCKVLKKNGEMCNAFVNSNLCEVCVYHVKQEYSKCSSRAAFSSSGNLNLRNKVLGKNEVFYAGKSFTSITPSGKNKKTSVKDISRLKGLGTTVVTAPEVVSVPYLQRSNEILKLLPSVNNPLNKKKSDKSRLDLLTSKIKTDPYSGTNNSSDLKLKCIEDKVSFSNQFSIDKSAIKSTVSGIILPKLSNPENELDASKSNVEKTPNCSGTVKLTPSNKKKCKANLQQRFNSLLHMQSKVNEEKNNVSINHCTPPSKNFEKTVKKQSEKCEDLKISKSFDAKHISTKDKTYVSTTSPLGDPKTSENSDAISMSTKPKIMTGDKYASAEISEINENIEICGESLSALFSDKSRADKSEELLRTTLNPIRKQTMTGLNTPSNSKMSNAKMKALLYVKAKGPISKENPTKKKINGRTASLKRPFPTEDEEDNKKCVLSERFIQLMNQKSLHEDLIELREHEQELEYFEKMEKKDRLEEKMLNTYKVDCKAVKCLKCNYMWFSASDACKSERHPLKVVDAVKRFFKCSHCQNRTVSLTIIPLLPCRKCSSTSWVRTAMIKEKLAKNDSLSIRGGEQKHLNSVITNAGLNLLVPDE